ncbi:TylF/MycF/NovP-related O-methyltransferase [Acidisphaera sp. L21]|uniref:TylF/MycF/NovP-related O-methyltransferase n=1 Tax=Acidisphaera sp. L21 TaxID=1641851 RepID=UPI00131B8AC2|nr:TylF/MycF/NovP-related O-methyltransferase [Acidisphaera sp. L21]
MARLELAILSGHKDSRVLSAIRTARAGRESLLSGNEAFTLFSMARAQSNMAGSMAEVGVYQGCSAKIISMASGNADLHLFDTFEGLPEPESSEKAWLRTGLYAAGLPSVQAFLADRQNISFHPGLFPQSAGYCPEARYSFVHLDVDLHASTLACLEYFYPRMVPGGIILSHDYSYLHGVKDAFAEFLAGKPESAIELPTSQAMLVKR